MAFSLADNSYIMGPSGFATPPQAYAELAAGMYLDPNGFTGTATVLSTPEVLGWFDTFRSELQGAAAVVNAIEQGVADGTITPANPAYVFGYSESAALSTFAMDWLSGQSSSLVSQWSSGQWFGGFTQPVATTAIPADDVHFVLVGDTAAPNGGFVNVMNTPSMDWTQLLSGGATYGGPTPNDLYPTDVYDLEYDGWADFPKYINNSTAVSNALVGQFLEHEAYLGLPSSQLDAAVVVQDGMTTYHYIPAETLPLIAGWLTVPLIGRAIYDLFEPEMQVQVDLGYGHLDLNSDGKLDLSNFMNGFNDGGPEALTTVVSGSPDFSSEDINSAMSQAWTLGWADFWRDLFDPSAMPPLQNPYTDVLHVGEATGELNAFQVFLLELLGW